MTSISGKMTSTNIIPEDIFNKPEIYPPKIIDGIRKIASVVSVEPTVFISMFSSIMYQLGVQNLYLEKACRVEIGFNQSVCDAMTIRNGSGYETSQETEVQKLVTQMMALRAFIQGTFPVIVVIFAGSWSDRHNRRKPLILFPILGEILCCVLLIVNSVFFYELPLIFSTLGDSIPFALLGGWPCFNNGVYSYVGSKFKNEEKTMRIGIVTASSISGLLVGSSVSGIILPLLGFVPFFSLCISLFLVAFVLGYFRVQEVKPRSNKTDTWREIFSISHIVQTFKTGFRAAPNNRRYKILALLFSTTLLSGAYYGEINLYYLYTRLKFAWDSATFAIFISFQLIVQVFGSVMSVVLFSRILHWDDTFLGIISIIGSISANILFALSPREIFVFIASCCDIFLMSAPIALKSIMTKIVPLNELGQANALLALAETLVPLIFGPIYTSVYKYTLDIFPGSFLIMSALLRSCSFCIFIWLFRQAILARRHPEIEEKNNPEDSAPESLKLEPVC
ncbi:hypothetical protein WA026_021365 [Henosepilachna vigintioctopunctata]|uniref:Solute carrier family 46 member 3 n=1 Tax=Henosepilachna vigintioctopunctata TaxID=420089 RepID=A0AAW1TS14_9CUCU